MLPRPSQIQISSSAPYSRKPLAYTPLSASAIKFHTHIKKGNIIVLCILNLSTFWIAYCITALPTWRLHISRKLNISGYTLYSVLEFYKQHFILRRAHART
jgi:hypothetical protein